MPFVHIELIEGRTVEQKRKLAKAVTDAVVSSLGVPDTAVTVIMRDMAKHDLAKAGKLRCDETPVPAGK